MVGLQKFADVNYVNDTFLTCVLPVVKAGKFKIEVTVAGQSSNEVLFKSVPATIKSVDPMSGPTTVGYPITILGSGFTPDAKHVVTVGDFLCSDVTVDSDTKLTCKMPKGVAGVQNITVIVNGNPSKVNTEFAYNAPTVAFIQPAHGKPSGGTKIVIKGRDFGSRRPKQGTLVASVGGHQCQKTKWVSDTEVECVSPEGSGSCKAVTVRVGRRDSQVSAANTFWHYEDAGEASKSHVVKLNAGNFDEIVNGDRPVMINFCKRGCEFCQAAKPIYEEIARMLKCKSVVLASVRVDKFLSLAKRFSLKESFPRMLFFGEGRTTPSSEFNGKFVAENLLGFMAKQMRIGAKVEEPVDVLKPDGLVDGYVDTPNAGMKRCSNMKPVQVPQKPADLPDNRDIIIKSKNN